MTPARQTAERLLFGQNTPTWQHWYPGYGMNIDAQQLTPEVEKEITAIMNRLGVSYTLAAASSGAKQIIVPDSLFTTHIWPRITVYKSYGSMEPDATEVVRARNALQRPLGWVSKNGAGAYRVIGEYCDATGDIKMATWQDAFKQLGWDATFSIANRFYQIDIGPDIYNQITAVRATKPRTI